MVKKAEGTDRAFFWGTDFSTQGYMKWTLGFSADEASYKNATRLKKPKTA